MKNWTIKTKAKLKESEKVIGGSTSKKFRADNEKEVKRILKIK